MILIGQYDSPFVRRVGIALNLYGMSYEHRPWSVWADAERIAQFNPLRRVPTLVLDDGEVLIESAAILDALDEMAGPGRALLPASGAARQRALRVCALATGLADKAVSLVYEGVLRPDPSVVWVERCRAQIADVLDRLEADRAAAPSPWWLGETIGHPDIAVACAIRFTREAHGALFDAARWPRLAAHADGCEAMEVFQTISQPLKVSTGQG
jgi:glutathione S-transferase